MKKILFVCHGNICRSPMAEFIMKDIVKKAGMDDQFHIESAATSTEEIGNSVYPPARRKLAEHGISCEGKTARQMTRSDYDRFDLLVGMDEWNIRNMKRIAGGDPDRDGLVRVKNNLLIVGVGLAVDDFVCRDIPVFAVNLKKQILAWLGRERGKGLVHGLEKSAFLIGFY